MFFPKLSILYLATLCELHESRHSSDLPTAAIPLLEKGLVFSKQLLNNLYEPLIHLKNGHSLTHLVKCIQIETIPRRAELEDTRRIRYSKHSACQRGIRFSRETELWEKGGTAWTWHSGVLVKLRAGCCDCVQTQTVVCSLLGTEKTQMLQDIQLSLLPSLRFLSAPEPWPP